jgi:APA family basic amino acid/polyamine antiporter
VLVLGRGRVDADHFGAPVVIPGLAIASCLLLLRQHEARTWLFAGILLAVGVLLHLLPGRRGGATRARRWRK